MKRIELESTTLNVIDQGSGPPLVLIHSFPFNGQMWESQLAELPMRARLIIPDLRGFGESDVTEGTVTMDQHAEDIRQLLDILELTTPVTLGGCSMGGYIALAFAERYPERIASLIMMDTKTEADTEEQRTNRFRMVDTVLTHGMEPVADVLLPKLFAPETIKEQSRLVEAARKMILPANPQGIAASIRGMAERPDRTAVLEKLHVPLLAIVGASDAITPPMQVRELACRVEQNEFLEVAEAGHMPAMENPEPVNAAIIRHLCERHK